MTTSPNYIAIDPDGDFRPVPPSYAGIKRGLRDATFDVVVLGDGEHTLFVDDEGMLNGSRLNVPASLFAGRAIYGPVVLTGGVDDEGETLLPSLERANAFMTLAHMWRMVESSAAVQGQSLAVTANVDTIPPPTVLSLTDDELHGWMNGDPEVVEAINRRMVEGREG